MSNHLSLICPLVFVVPLTLAVTETTDLLENLSLESQPNAAENEPVKKAIYANTGNLIYQQGYGYTPLGLNPPIPTMGQDGQLYGTQQYQYPNPYYRPPPSATMLHSPSQAITSQVQVPSISTVDTIPMSGGGGTGNPNYAVNSSNLIKTNGSKPFRPSNQNYSNSNGNNERGNWPSGFPSSGYQDPWFGCEGFQSPIPWVNASGSGFSSPLNSYPTRLSGLGQASDFMNYMYQNNRMYGQYGNRAGSLGYNSWTSGRGWVVVDNKYRPRCRSYGNENVDGLSELNRGPRAKGSKNQKEFGPVTEAVVGPNVLHADANKEENLSLTLDKEQYNREDFLEEYLDAKFFVIKSYSEDDVHKSIKYNVWSSTPNGNKKLDAAYREAMDKSGDCPVFLLFSVNTSGQFVGLAEMVDPVDYGKTVDYWQQEKWIGCFPVKWHIIKDVPNNFLRHITLENNDNKPVTNSRDTQEVAFEKGIQMLKIFKSHKSRTSILDDFDFYAARERIMQERRAKQKIQKQVSDAKPACGMTNDIHKTGTMITENTRKSADLPLVKESVGLVKENGEVKLVQENGSNASSENSVCDSKLVVSPENNVFSNVVASAC
ncbi:hypothetical protein K2173_025562 [Erythroxylum novogranatense]|uniref:YTH domain-containing family protein n=1 Tax=Erythroxylum novogranatense TaxID=1862640 RepID=A0AAV8T8P5_9ROSI|nr:hypothetical protein K2173_025562 [Erythroxylum novogranatense]